MRTRPILVMMFIVATTQAIFAQTNGSFEDGINPGFFDDLFTGQTNITGWTVTGSVDYIGTLWQASDGVRSVDLAGDFAGALSQGVETTPGLFYSVTFDMSGNPDGGPVQKIMTVTADGGSPQTYTYTNGTATRADMQWETNTYYFGAADTETVIAFTSVTQGFFRAGR